MDHAPSRTDPSAALSGGEHASEGTSSLSAACFAVNASIPLIPSAAIYDPVGERIYYSSGGGVFSFNTSDLVTQNVAAFGGGLNAQTFAYDSRSGTVFVGNFWDDSLSLIDSSNNSLIAALPLPLDPYVLLYDSDNNELYIAGQNEHPATYNLTILNATSEKVVGNIPLPNSYPMGMALDPTSGDIFLAEDSTDNVTVIDGSTSAVVTNVPVGQAPIAVVYDPLDAMVYVENQGSHDLSVLDPMTAPCSRASRWRVSATSGLSPSIHRPTNSS